MPTKVPRAGAFQNDLSNLFLTEIENYINSINDPAFVAKTKNPDKSMEQCVAYILATVQESKITGWSDAEIFGMAKHYFDEASITVGKHSECRIVINREVQLTAEEIAAERLKAIAAVHADQQRKMTAAPKQKIVPSPNNIQNTLFE